jgi:methyl-accepting chemotaxis protein
MFHFGSGMSAGATSAEVAAAEAAREALQSFGGKKPKLGLVFASVSYADANAAARAVKAVVGDIPIVGGTSGAAVLGPTSVASRGVSVVLLGGEDLEVATTAAELGGPEMVDVVPAAREIATAADEAARLGFSHYACLVFAPGISTDGDALVAAVRKGLGARAQLAGGLTGDDMTFDRPRVFVRDELRDGHVVLAGLFTKKHVGISARHGWRPVGPVRTVTRAIGPKLFELDGRPALGVWLEDVRNAGGALPTGRQELLVFLANHYEMALTDSSHANELVARAPWRLEDDGAVMLSGSIGEGRHVRLVHASRKDLLRAATNAASDAVIRAGNQVAGALVFPCAGRIACLGDEFPDEPRSIRERIAAPIGGACVFGEIARTERDIDAFFNTTAVVVAFAA